MSVNLRSELVAKPLMIEVRLLAPERGATPGQKPEETSRPGPAGEPSDTEWTEVAAKAGRPVDGCVLEGALWLVGAGKADLVISLVCEDIKLGC